MNKKAEIYDYLKAHPGATLPQIANAMPWDYYHNRRKYFREIITRMIKSGWIAEPEKGKFYIIPRPIRRPPAKKLNDNQMNFDF